MRKRTLLTLLVIALSTGVDRHEASAATTVRGFMTVAAAVDSRCSVGVSMILFGSYDSRVTNATSPLDAQGSVSLVCDRGRVVRVRIGQGLYPEATSTDNAPLRQMAMGTQRLRYNLYEDAARSVVWTNGAPGVRPPGNTFPVTIPIYARVPAGQTPSPGDYADSVVVTAIF